ncbi:MAG: lytic murein transglycosylase [Gammaproteobacteria bacterium]
MVNTVYKPVLALITVMLTACGGESVTQNDDYSSGMKRSLPRSAQKANNSASRQTASRGKGNSVLPLGSDEQIIVTGVYGNSIAVRDFIRHMVDQHGFDQSYLSSLFSRANRLQSVIRLETAQQPTPATPPRPGSWSRYRSKFLTGAHIENGVTFWANNAGVIRKASAAYGVDPEYIVAIIGVETFFGRNTGKTRIFDALTTLAFDTQRRSRFFTEELENFLLMTREEGYDPLELTGSWAGAMGLGQFMPSSFRKLAIDFDSDGRRDLWQSNDAIGSVAHYFANSGWRKSEPVALRAGSAHESSTIALSTYKGYEYWHVYPNFKVIKSYNNSDKYAMAVHQLAQAIKQRYY